MPLDGLGDNEAALIQFGREVFSAHHVSAGTYARALKIFGERDLVDLVSLMAQHAGDAVLLAAFDQHLPPGQAAALARDRRRQMSKDLRTAAGVAAALGWRSRLRLAADRRRRRPPTVARS